MYCKKCGSSLQNNEGFCQNCGEKIIYENNQQNDLNTNNNYNNESVSQFFQSENNNQNSDIVNDNFQSLYNQNNSNYISDEELIDAYIGKNSQKIKKKVFSFSTFFFGVIYFFYRKMNKFASIWFLFNIVIGMLLNTFENGMLSLILTVVSSIPNIVFAFMFKKIYMNKVQKEVDLIKKMNEGKTKEELVEICKKKGGTSKAAIIYGIIVFICIVFLVYVQVSDELKNNQSSSYDNIYNDYENDNKENNKEDSESLELIYTIPNGLTLEGGNTYSDGEYYTYKRTDTTGDIYSIVIATRESNNSILSEIIELQQSFKNSFKTEFNNAIDYTYTTGSVQIKKINENSWYYVNDIASSDTVGLKIYSSIYAISKNEKHYIVGIIKYKDDDTISSDYFDFINSLNFKKKVENDL